jgi:hypothetical protein
MLGRGLTDNTVRRRLGRARQFFAAAIDKGVVQKISFFPERIKVAGPCDTTEPQPRSRTNPAGHPNSADFRNPSR